MTPEEMNLVIERHVSAEQAGDTAGAVAVYTDDIEHDVVGSPTGPVLGKHAAQGFYDQLVADIQAERMVPLRGFYGDDFCVIEHEWAGTVPGTLLGIPGHGRAVTFRMLHIFEFRGGLISRENVWLDTAAIVAQLTEPQDALA